MTAQAPGERKLRVFVSYSRSDQDAVRAVVHDVQESGFDVNVDWRDLDYGTEWKQRLEQLIRDSDTVLFFVSPSSIKSEVCDWELEIAGRHAKRIFPLMIVEMPITALPARLSERQVLPPTGIYAREKHLSTLVEALTTDRPWLIQATRLTDQAHEWEQQQFASGLLLSSTALKNADTWAAVRPPGAPQPSRQILTFIDASRKRASWRQRWAFVGALSVAAVAGALALAALAQRQAALEQRDAALINRSRLLADAAHQKIKSGDAATGLLLALEGLPNDEEGKDRPDVPEAQSMLLSGLLNLKEKDTFDINGGAVLSPDGTKLAYGTAQSSVVVVSFPSREKIAELPHDDAEIHSIAFSPDGSRLATNASDGKVRIWDVASGSLIIDLSNEGGFNSSAFSPDGKTLLLTNGSAKEGAQPGAIIWDTASRERVVLLRHPSPVTTAQFSFDGRWIATATDDGTVRVFDREARQQTFSVKAHADKIYQMAFSHDGRQLATSSHDKTIRIWNLADGALAQTLSTGFNAETAIEFGNDDARLVSVSGGNLTAWDVKNGEKALDLNPYFRPVYRPFNLTYPVVHTADGGRSYLTAHLDDTARLWTFGSAPPLLLDPKCGTVKVVPSDDGTVLASYCYDPRELRVWDVVAGRERLMETENANIVDVFLTPDGSESITLLADGTARVHDTRDGRILASLSIGSALSVGALDPQGQRLLLASESGEVKLWTRQTDDSWSPAPTVFEAGSEKLGCLAFSPTGDRVAGLSANTALWVWNADDGKTRLQLKSSVRRKDEVPDFALSCAYSPDGRYVATDAFGQIDVWNVETGESLSTIQTSGMMPSMKLAFSADSRRLISGNMEAEVRIAEVSSGRRMNDTEANSSVPFAYDAEHELLAMTDNENDFGLRLYDALTLRPIALLEKDIDGVALAKNGAHIYAHTTDGKIYVWSIAPPGPARVQAARSAAPRCLAPMQREKAGLEPSPPRWCITGPDHVAEPDPSHWMGKWPYHTAAWRDWLAARDRGETPRWPDLKEYELNQEGEDGLAVSNEDAPATSQR